MEWLITGGCGFIGRNLILRLIANEAGDVSIRILDCLVESSREDLSMVTAYRETDADAVRPMSSHGVELVVGDIRDRELVRRCAEGAEVIIHLAASTGVQPSIDDPHMDCDANVRGTLNALDAARLAGCRSFVMASSGAPLGTQEPPIHEEMVPRPLSPYGASKLAGEAYCSAFYGSYGLPTIALRFGNVYGPLSSRKQSVVAKFIRLALAGEALEIYGDGAQTRDFIYVGDIVSAIVLGAQAGIGGEVFQIATQRETTVREIADKIATIVERETQKTSVIVHGDPLPGEVRRNSSDISKARRLLGWKPMMDLDTGLVDTVRWFMGVR